MKHTLISVAVIHGNPHRNFTRNPIREDQVVKILDSINRTGFWENTVVRPHPTKKGEYELAHGHNRLEAVKRAGIKEVCLPVRDLNDWEMYDAMVDENETQQEVTPEIAFENVEAGVELLEKAFRDIGAEGTEEAFNRALGRVVSTDTTLRSKYDGGFEQARNAFFAGEGIGRAFIEGFLPCGHLRSNTLSVILSSRYAAGREAAKKKAAALKECEATAKAAEAVVATNPAEKERLTAAAEKARAQAARLRAEAKRIGEGAISEKLLLSFKTVRQMTDFAAAVKTAGIPPSRHKAARELVERKEVVGKGMLREVSAWWYEESGEGARDRARREREETFKRFNRRIKGGNLESYLRTLVDRAKALTADVDLALDAAGYCELEPLRQSVARQFELLIASAGKLVAEVSGDVIELKPAVSGKIAANGAEVAGYLT